MSISLSRRALAEDFRQASRSQPHADELAEMVRFVDEETHRMFAETEASILSAVERDKQRRATGQTR